jgi:hypothetical protein
MTGFVGSTCFTVEELALDRAHGRTRKIKAGMISLLIQAVVRKNGSVDVIRVLRGLGYGLDESAVSTISQKWRFAPGTLDGIPVDVIANIEVSFRLF